MNWTAKKCIMFKTVRGGHTLHTKRRFMLVGMLRKAKHRHGRAGML